MPELLKKFWEQAATPVELLGFAGQFVFFLRFFVQWLASEKRKESVIPESFWWISFAGSLLTLSYGLVKVLPPIVVSQLAAGMIYGRNIILVRRRKRRLGAAAPAGSAEPPAP